MKSLKDLFNKNLVNDGVVSSGVVTTNEFRMTLLRMAIFRIVSFRMMLGRMSWPLGFFLMLNLAGIQGGQLVQQAKAAQIAHHHSVVSVTSALAGHGQSVPQEIFWISVASNRQEGGTVQDHAGRAVMALPNFAVSPYGAEQIYSVAEFYKQRRPRAALIGNYRSGLSDNVVISFGIDTGYRSAKLRISPSVFLGAGGVFILSKDTELAYSVGSWFGGEISESPCLDDYNRAFQCFSLLPWTERMALKPPSKTASSGLVRLRVRF